MQVSVVGVYVR